MKSQGKKVREIRKLLRLSQSEFAESIDLSQAALSYIESGESIMGLPVLRNLINIHKVNPYYLLNEGDDEPMFSKSRKSSMELRELKSKLARVRKSLGVLNAEIEKITQEL